MVPAELGRHKSLKLRMWVWANALYAIPLRGYLDPMRRGLVPWLLFLLLLVVAVGSGIVGLRQAPTTADLPTPADLTVSHAVQRTLNAPDYVAVATSQYDTPTGVTSFYPLTTSFRRPDLFKQMIRCRFFGSSGLHPFGVHGTVHCVSDGLDEVRRLLRVDGT